ncbi:isochorismatase family protein [Variovorax sp. OV329]|uniref:isochorismatase family protein n=1 Tax=Variovorax sp. OV329 TaxID=1882825 RepID=UPI0008F2B6AF|nr:isochorismatase family protein [Variovorax sp. OV329]SFN15303.1 Nicotinamidase-related amidase [Variovorax sp. OV329]
MPITTLDSRTALVLVDLQKGIVALPTADPSTGVVARAAELAVAFRSKGLPVVLVNVLGGAPGRTDPQAARPAPGADWAELVAELQAHPQDILVSKKTWGAFTGTSLEAALRERGVTQIVLAGISTSIGVESTARQAHELGFHVTLVVDAMTDLNEQAHANSLARIFPRLGETGLTKDVVAMLETR